MRDCNAQAGVRPRGGQRIDVRQDDVAGRRVWEAGEGGLEAGAVGFGVDRGEAVPGKPCAGLGVALEGVERRGERVGGKAAVPQEAGGDPFAVGVEFVVAEGEERNARREQPSVLLDAQRPARGEDLLGEEVVRVQVEDAVEGRRVGRRRHDPPEVVALIAGERRRKAEVRQHVPEGPAPALASRYMKT